MTFCSVVCSVVLILSGYSRSGLCLQMLGTWTDVVGMVEQLVLEPHQLPHHAHNIYWLHGSLSFSQVNHSCTVNHTIEGRYKQEHLRTCSAVTWKSRWGSE